MIDRFTNATSGPQNLRWALHRQPFTCRDAEFVDRLANCATLEEWEAGQFVFEQASDGQDLYCVLAGSVSIRIHGREVAIRKAGEHFGEMSVIDPTVRRSASVVACGPAVTARFSEHDFASLAADFPFAWRMVAAEMADRLRQRSELVRPQNARPKVFVGSSAEAIKVVTALHEALQHEAIDFQPWTLGVFGGSRFTIEDLEAQVQSADFAVLVISPDDEVVSRKVEYTAPRDNVIFELGLFMGALTRNRTFLLSQRGQEIKIPSDLLGFSPLFYADGTDEMLVARLGPASSALRRSFVQLGCR